MKKGERHHDYFIERCIASPYLSTDTESNRAGNFRQGTGLSDTHKELLKQMISEAKISGLTKEDFFEECERLFKED